MNDYFLFFDGRNSEFCDPNGYDPCVEKTQPKVVKRHTKFAFLASNNESNYTRPQSYSHPSRYCTTNLCSPNTEHQINRITYKEYQSCIKTMDFGEVTVHRDLQLCLADQQAGISVDNVCRISGDNNKCPAGSTLTYSGETQSIDAYIKCPLDAVSQSQWREGSQKGLCSCESSLYDASCGLIDDDMDCVCFGCPFGMTLGFAYSCTTEIVGPCKSFDCNGKCNGKYDPGNLVGDRETFPPTVLDQGDDKVSSASRNDLLNNHVMGTAVMAVALFRMIF